MELYTTYGESKQNVVFPQNLSSRVSKLLALKPLGLFPKQQGQRLRNYLSA